MPCVVSVPSGRSVLGTEYVSRKCCWRRISLLVKSRFFTVDIAFVECECALRAMDGGELDGTGIGM